MSPKRPPRPVRSKLLVSVLAVGVVVPALSFTAATANAFPEESSTPASAAISSASDRNNAVSADEYTRVLQMTSPFRDGVLLSSEGIERDPEVTSNGRSLEARSNFKPPSFCKPLGKADAAREKAKEVASWGSAEHKKLARDYAKYTNRGAMQSPEKLAAWLRALARVYVAGVYNKQPAEADMDLLYGAKNWFIPVIVEMCGFDPWR